MNDKLSALSKKGPNSAKIAAAMLVTSKAGWKLGDVKKAVHEAPKARK